MSGWADAVWTAVQRQAAKSADGSFTRVDLIADELPRIVEEVGSVGRTPHYTLSRELQELRDAGKIEFVDDAGSYRLIVSSPVEMVCTWCGTADVARDAWAVWDVARQEWVLGTVFDDGFCQICQRERELTTRGLRTGSDRTGSAT